MSGPARVLVIAALPPAGASPALLAAWGPAAACQRHRPLRLRRDVRVAQPRRAARGGSTRRAGPCPHAPRGRLPRLRWWAGAAVPGGDVMTGTIRRSMKARSRDRLACGCVPSRGERLLLVEGVGWVCVTCLLRQAGQAASQARVGGSP